MLAPSMQASICKYVYVQTYTYKHCSVTFFDYYAYAMIL